MKWGIFLLFIAAVCLIQSIWQMDHHTTKAATSRLKLSADRATHDAALQVDKVVLAREGKITFASNAEAVFYRTLQRNLNFDESNRPKAGNLFDSSDQLELKVFEKLETGCPGSTPGFPCTYVNTTYGYIDTIRGPSIVAIITMKHPRNFGISADKTYIVGSSHEYVPF